MTARIPTLPRPLHCDEGFVLRLMAEAVMAGRPSFLSVRATDDDGTPLTIYTRFDRGARRQELIIEGGKAPVRLSGSFELEELRRETLRAA